MYAPQPTVAIDMTFPNRNRAGSRMYAYSLLQGLRRHKNGGEFVEISAARPGIGSTLRWLTSDARQRIVQSRANLLHCPAFITPWRSPVPFIITMHDAAARRFATDYSLDWRMYSQYFLPRLARRAARVITGTEASRYDLIHAFGLDPDRIAVTPYGIHSRYRQPVPTEAIAQERKRFNDDLLLLFPGAPLPRKNIAFILRVLAQAHPETVLGKARLLITGATEGEFPQLRDWIAQQGRHLQRRVTWLGRIPDEAMPAIYAAADVVVYPSLYEGFGFPPLEAMAVGTPVVASTASCLPEVLGDAALLVDPMNDAALAQALEQLLCQAQLRAHLVQLGKLRSAQYSWERCAAQTLEIYQQVLKKPASRVRADS
jgi:glycosyltransferase involved in cell wall biosynthesis